MTPRELLRLGDVDAAIWSVERSEAAQLVHAALDAGELTFDALRPHLYVLWQSTDCPCRRLNAATWIAWFKRAELRVPALPAAPVRAWRAQVGDELGLSWTYDREVAERFHGMNVGRRDCADARILEAVIPADAIVAHIPKPESELIVDSGCIGDRAIT